MITLTRATVLAAAAAAAAPLAAGARSPFLEYRAPTQLAPGVSAAPPLKATVLPQAFADSFGAKCLDGTPPAFYSLVQDPAKWVLFLEGGKYNGSRDIPPARVRRKNLTTLTPVSLTMPSQAAGALAAQTATAAPAAAAAAATAWPAARCRSAACSARTLQSTALL